MNWRTIDSAPKDGSTFLTFMPGNCINYDFAEWDEDYGEFCKHGCGWDMATHWMPLPAPPAPDTQKPAPRDAEPA